ncbi:MAG TPA: hypothetical protein VGE29_06395 [Prosthecobacter sp.]
MNKWTKSQVWEKFKAIVLEQTGLTVSKVTPLEPVKLKISDRRLLGILNITFFPEPDFKSGAISEREFRKCSTVGHVWILIYTYLGFQNRLEK